MARNELPEGSQYSRTKIYAAKFYLVVWESATLLIRFSKNNSTGKSDNQNPFQFLYIYGTIQFGVREFVEFESLGVGEFGAA